MEQQHFQCDDRIQVDDEEASIEVEDYPAAVRYYSFTPAIWSLLFVGVSVVVVVLSSSRSDIGVLPATPIDLSASTEDDWNEDTLLSANQNITYTTLPDGTKKKLFSAFLSKYGKSYGNSTEESIRYTNFKSTLEKVDERNALEKRLGGTAVHGINKLSDLSSDEFTEMYLISQEYEASTGGAFVEIDEYQGTEEKVNWNEVYTTGILDQGYCGGCWAISVASQIEADGVRQNLFKKGTQLSAQQIISCDRSSFGCSGGWTERGYMYVESAGGLALDSEYPYASYYGYHGQKCLDDDAALVVSIDTFYKLKTETDMINYVKSTGPLSTCLDATMWQTYQNGIITACGKNVDHCIQVVGIDTSEGNGYWLIRNSWGVDWGESGYARVNVGDDTCAISTDPTFTRPYLYKR